MDVREKSIEKAAERAAAYINIKPRTAYQVNKYLKEKGYDDDVIDDVVNQLKEYHYIDDINYAEMYFQYGFDKGRGVARIKRELLEKGIAHDVIDEVYDSLEEIPDQKEMAMEIALFMIKDTNLDGLDYDEKRRLQAKIGRRLISRGFSSDIAYKVIGEIVR